MYIVQYDMSYMENQKSVRENWKFVREKLSYYNNFSMYIRKNKNLSVRKMCPLKLPYLRLFFHVYVICTYLVINIYYTSNYRVFFSKKFTRTQ